MTITVELISHAGLEIRDAPILIIDNPGYNNINLRHDEVPLYTPLNSSGAVARSPIRSIWSRRAALPNGLRSIISSQDSNTRPDSNTVSPLSSSPSMRRAFSTALRARPTPSEQSIHASKGVPKACPQAPSASRVARPALDNRLPLTTTGCFFVGFPT